LLLSQHIWEPVIHGASGRQTPHLLDEALGWHERYVQTGSMRPQP
jgi:succinyl-CoA:acetate CoA-transferase